MAIRLETMRLQKYIAHCGAASRRKAETLIKEGRVSVNEKIVTDMGVLVQDGDRVMLDNILLRQEPQMRYIALNKPKGYITTAKDQYGRPTVMDLLQNIEERVYPVGRLDYDTTGLLLLTNDGAFANQMLHPSHEIIKIYEAKITGIPSRKEREDFENGVVIDGRKTAPAKIIVRNIIRQNGKAQVNCVVQITIHEGRNRQVKKMCEAIGHPVIALKRIQIGNLKLGDLKEGSWREFCPEEV